MAEDIQRKQRNNNRLNNSLNNPKKEVCVVEYAVLLADKVDFGEKSIEIFVGLVLFGDITVVFSLKYMSFDNCSHCLLFRLRYFCSWPDVVHILLKDSSNNQG